MSIPWLTELGWRRVDGFGAEGLLVIVPEDPWSL